MIQTTFLCIIVLAGFILILQYQESSNNITTLTTKSISFLGGTSAHKTDLEGNEINIAIIDTGVDFNHPDLFGEKTGRITIVGHNFIEGGVPFDTNGHGTQVAGIIAANGELIGMAPKSNLFVYKVSNHENFVSEEIVIQALEKAIEDKVDIINLSITLNYTNNKIADLIEKANKEGISVITAAGNDGPKTHIHGIASNNKVITVGATRNNVPATLIANLEVGDKIFQLIPFIGVDSIEPLYSKIVFGKYGRSEDLTHIDVENSILLVERGNEDLSIRLPFREKEKNASEEAASALIIYNFLDGNFIAELSDEKGIGNKPRIPVLSMSKEDGLILKGLLSQNVENGILRIYHNPDIVPFFSSRGEISTSKPDIVAPGEFINSTTINGEYKIVRGTSFSAAHVTGASALLLQKIPKLTPDELKSILVTTSDPVFDHFGNKYPFNIGGFGRLNVTKALEADLIVIPNHLMFNLSTTNESQTKELQFKKISGIDIPLKFNFDFKDKTIDFSVDQNSESLMIIVSSEDLTPRITEGYLIIEYDDTIQRIPIAINIAEHSLTNPSILGISVLLIIPVIIIVIVFHKKKT